MVTRGLILASALALSACAMDPQAGYRPVERSGGAQGMSFSQANAQCWETSMNIAGYGATIAQQAAYTACMQRNGWEDRRRLF